MKYILVLLLLCLASDHTQANGNYLCHALEDSDLTQSIDLNHHQGFDPVWHINFSFAVSDDQRLIALYQGSLTKGQATFTLFDSQTGKLLQRQTLENFEERSHQTTLHFSPQNRFVYLSGMSYDKTVPHSHGAIPFWNLADNQIIFSPCTTAMGLRKVQFSDDLTVAHAETVDSYHSLCSTTEAKVLARINGFHTGGGDFSFNLATKQLFAKFAVTNDENYQGLLKTLGKNNPHVTLYKSPVPEDKFNSKNNDTFSTTLLGTPATPRLLVAKTRANRLYLSLWDYTKRPATPGKVYQHEHLIPALQTAKKPVANHSLVTSADGKTAALLSKAGVLIVFEIATGQLLWQKHLPPRHTRTGYANYVLSINPLTATQAIPVPPLVLEQREPQALLLFNWQNGQQRQFALPDSYTHSYEQHDTYLVLQQVTGHQGQLLLLNWQTGRQQRVDMPPLFKDSWWSARIPESQQLIYKPGDTTRKPPYSMLVLDLLSGKYRVLTTPYPDDRYYAYDTMPFHYPEHYPAFVKLAHGYHSIQPGKHLNTDNKMQDSFDLHGMNDRKTQILQMADLFLYSKVVRPENKPPELHTIAYDEQEKRAKYCRLQLEHEH